MRITQINEAGPHKTGTIVGVSVEDIEMVLGFKSNVDDDPYKVKYSWGFKVNGQLCGIWDYKGSHKFNEFSTYGPDKVFIKLFGDNYHTK